MTNTPYHDHQHHHQFLSRSPSQVELVPSLSSEIGFSSPLHRHLFRMISTRMSGLMVISTMISSMVISIIVISIMVISVAMLMMITEVLVGRLLMMM